MNRCSFSLWTAQAKKEAESWVKGLEYVIEKKPTSYLAIMDIWLAKQYESMIECTNQHRWIQQIDFIHILIFNCIFSP